MKRSIEQQGLRLVPALVMIGLALGACGDGGIKQQNLPTIAVTEGARNIPLGGVVTVSSSASTFVEIGNDGLGELVVSDISIASTPPGAFTVTSLPDPSDGDPIRVAPGGLSHQFSLNYDPSVLAQGEKGSATVTIRTNITLNADTTFTFEVGPEVAAARLVIQPTILNFNEVAAGTSSTLPANILNTGNAPLTLTRVVFSGHPGYTAQLGGNSYTVTAESAANGITLSPGITIAPGSAAKVDVTFLATGEEPAQGSMLFFTNEPDSAGSQLKLYANLEGPCIKTNPGRVAFGGKLVGATSEQMLEIQSCGDVELVISDIEMIDDGNGAFDVRDAELGTYPLRIPAGTSVLLPVTYTPFELATLGDDGQFGRDVGTVQIRSDANIGDLDIALEGFGTDGTCPIPDILVREGYEVIPQTVLHLSALASVAPQSTIATYEWSVVQPGGSVSTFIPSATVAEPTFEANIIGEYIFRLKVTDARGIESCSSTEKTVIVTSDDAIHVELLWRTPGDLDETDTGSDPSQSVGSDVDLHFLHPLAFGRYFEPLFDCYWQTRTPEWGMVGFADNPRLDRDDQDGGGPENLNMQQPERDTRYQVGVHYWNDWGYGETFATVRVYIYDVLRDQWDNVRLGQDDLWDTHYIDWPSATVTRISISAGGHPKITPNFTGGPN